MRWMLHKLFRLVEAAATLLYGPPDTGEPRTPLVWVKVGLFLLLVLLVVLGLATQGRP